ncbi:CoA-binding protein [Sulfurospirillum arcachonense]|uniref:CoA-binding protein n=1 Tax=Sulfurospirillum arcachonense TaxID=57666 RepID=UPI000469962F|nr:CoA-binding protein [Sulfurospirillum arcachonense]
MECSMPSINTNDDKVIKQIFENCRSIAIIGLSPDESKPSHMVAKYLQDCGYKIIPVYPKEDYILGEKVYRSLEEIEEKVDMVDMFRKADFADVLVQTAIKREDVKYFWIQLGLVNDEAFKAAMDAGMIAVQNKCTKIEHKRLLG